ncbi:MAG: class I SAM-dependent methyltransferase [Planctomycetota bacterium]
MHDKVYDQLAAVEDRHWWHASRNELLRLYLRRLSLPTRATALDIGCGTGSALGVLSEFTERVIGVDCSDRAIALAGRKHPFTELHTADIHELPGLLATERFDLITLLNVLYHEWVPDELVALQSIWQLLNPGGFLLITDAAFNCLYRRHDRVGMGKRRYTLSNLREQLCKAGFEWTTGTYFNAASLPIIGAMALWDRVAPTEADEAPLRELEVPPFPVNQAMKWTMALERAVLRVIRKVPLGVSLLCIGRKPLARIDCSEKWIKERADNSLDDDGFEQQNRSAENHPSRARSA